MYKKLIVTLALFLLPFHAFGQNYASIKNNGLKGEELISVAVHPQNENIIFVGTNNGLYKKDLAKNSSWERIGESSAGKCRVNQIYFNPYGNLGYIATDKGLYSFNPDSLIFENVFTKSNNSERDCISVCMLANGSIFVGTKGGLFFKKKDQQEWSKISFTFDNGTIVFLYAQDDIVYLAGQSGVYKSENLGEQWEKIFNVYAYPEVSDEGVEDSGNEEVETESTMVKHITGIPSYPSMLYVAAANGVFLTEDGGKSWSQLTLSGLDFTNLRFLVIGPMTEGVLGMTKTGIYEFKDKEWKKLFSAFDCRQMALRGQSIILITSRDIFEYSMPMEHTDANFQKSKADSLLSLFDHEPSIEEVQKMAIDFAEVSDKKIKGWRRRANVKALLPEFSLGYDKTIYGSSSGACFVGPKSWDVNLKWDLSELIYNTDQTSIDTRSKLMVQLRNDILAEVTSLYFERRKLQLELLTKKPDDQKEDLAKKLRLMELTALLDRLTGSNFSKILKNGK